MSVTSDNDQERLVNALEDTYKLLQKTQVNLKKCPKQRLTRGYVEARLQCIEGYWQTFTKTHQELVKCTPKCKQNEISYFLNEEYFLVEDLYSCLVGDMKDMLLSTSTTDPSTSKVMPVHEPFVKLPQIELPTFAGCYDDWPTFRDLFTTLINNNTSLSKVQKLHYLKSSIVGEPEVLLKHVSIEDNNYDQAWNILLQRYGNRRLIVNTLLQKLFHQKRIINPTSNNLKNLLDTTDQCLNNLKNQDIPTESWDQVIIYLVVQRLDIETHKAWEEFSYKEDPNVLPTWADMKTFLKTKFRTLEMVSPAMVKERILLKAKTFHATASENKDTSTTLRLCSMCKADHALCNCKDFCKLQPGERNEFVKQNRLCYNCLMAGHSVVRCRIPTSCRRCKRRHHTLLHESINDNQSESITMHQHEREDLEPNAMKDNESEVEISSHFAAGRSTTLLATAIVTVRNDKGHSSLLRALIDQGSQANFISERAAQLLKVKRSPAKGKIIGVGNTQTSVNHVVQIELQSRCDDKFKLNINAYVMPTKLTSQLPTKQITRTLQTWPHLERLTLADPSFHTPGRIDLLLGVDVYAQILKAEILKGRLGSPCAQNTSLGWILFGQIQTQGSQQQILVMHHCLDIDNMLKSLWEVDIDTRKILTKDEETCERIYNETHSRSKEGRYIVKLPFKTVNPQCIKGNTKEGALKRLLHLEKRFEKNENLRNSYTKEINDYCEKEHMEKVPEQDKVKAAVYLPHHPVFKFDSETTQVRPVFDASHRGSNNIALNDELLIGPQIQEDMRSLVMRWRLKRVAFTADIQKMYRQILVTKEDTDYQRILWRNNTQDPIQEYRLIRVTFGTACAPYLAVKTLHQVADDEGENNKIAAETIKHDFYMDDLMSGQDTVEEAVSVAKSVRTILQKGGFTLQKWASNRAEFLKEFHPAELSSHVNIQLSLDGMIKTLGLSWNMGEDMLQYNLKLPSVPTIITKRQILAEVQTLFDPLGWLAPALIPAKLMIQKLWLEGVDWDEELPLEIKREWLDIRDSLQHIEQIKIKRWLNTTLEALDNVSIHGYCDASIKAYGAVAYLRVQGNDGYYSTYIIAAKTKVAPIKCLSLPRLELCGALLLSKLLKQISEAMHIPKKQIFCWTDSTIVLSWLQGDPSRWQTFVRNRVITIFDNIGTNWFHVTSENNPADIASRGMLAPDLKKCALWWKGPELLKQKEIIMERLINNNIDLEKKLVNICLNIKNEGSSIYKSFENFENLPELLKTITYVKRFLNFKGMNKNTIQSTIQVDEIEDSLQRCLKITQSETFGEEIQDLKDRGRLKRTSSLRSLNPFLDSENLLRVGGRVIHSDLDHNRKHPVILKEKGPLTWLLVAEAHQRTLHGGVQLMLNYLRSRYWIIKVKNVVKKYLHKCIVCAKLAARTRTQLMGDLPRVRVTPARPFLHSGVDFAGPYDILMSKGRGAKTNKSYISIFVCMSTKAIHLELVGNLTSESFIGAFRRFVARRGRCSDLWSDQGRNFVGANKELSKAFKEAEFELDGDISEILASDGTQWHFIPAYSPSFGGLWEAGVKSMKYHLKRILNTHLTFEEMSTILCQVEACLNSRPLCPMDNTDADNLNVLTPGHFLIGESPVTIPSPSLKDLSVNSLSRWNLSQKLLANFWQRWQQEYLVRLQQRPKWLTTQKEFDIGQIVLIKTDGLPPGKWHLGRIIDKHPGTDGITRVYSVKSGNNIVKRSITKLCFIPIDTIN